MNLSEINIELFRMFNDLGKEVMFLNPIMIFFAKYMKYFLLFGIVMYWFTRKRENRIMIISSMFAFVVAEVFGAIAGAIHSNNQPFAELSNVNQLIGHAIDNSFPSDHAIEFFSICITFLLFKKNLRYVWLAIAILVSISRVWVGVHYPADILVGAILGIIGAALCYWIIPQLNVIKKLLDIYEQGEDYVLSKVSK
ncbi:bacitracin ABC transporter permease [Mammaliicoccus lentus]|uniref:undecaprenyl-diphosphatase n=1 Tax=Mammaliicoccus TaxID=2803850 RepID=UPI0007D97332|nr:MULTISPECIES: undecaprenyl-diphosphatase [Mammaliicoccus]MBW0770079.1 undecaprenyl-diphosphatase [Mammaliicoccus lentus]MCD2477761.1 undecaprenyl-diphosphatase [Mammaliicoccus lentus]MCD2521757.1 undecaprenyl-diphosphatase [Mammaliicoccus lentus]MEB8092005.1 undecaprenyl-diphosphatase [Mammaliicoccus lentus]OAO32822.1 bacitracin ABC transporter permease [Mammaliicoccus lentus]